MGRQARGRVLTTPAKRHYRTPPKHKAADGHTLCGIFLIAAEGLWISMRSSALVPTVVLTTDDLSEVTCVRCLTPR